MLSPFTTSPSDAARKAAAEVINKVHAYMRAHPYSELHQCGKMFGVLLVESRKQKVESPNYLAAFSAMLDGSYEQDGFVPPVYEPDTMPIGSSCEESQRLQRLLFAQYKLLNGRGESKNLLEIFANEKPILSEEEFFNKSQISNFKSQISNPPAGAGECCAPKLLQYAFANGLQPVELAEFWVGAPSKKEIRIEGAFYPPCSGKCVPILRHMLQGLDIVPSAETRHAEALCRQIEILYEDEWLLVVNKPSGLLAVPGKTAEPSVESYLNSKLKTTNHTFIKAAHRLDQDTSGILVFAKTPEVYTALQSYFQRRDILKRYEAIVKSEGVKELMNEGTISLPLLPNPYDRPRQIVDWAHGKPAITRYVIRERRADGTLLVDFYPLTGRTHQLRVHAAHPDGLNAPIVGDRLYNGERLAVNGERMMLHAAEITFVHPVTQEKMHFCKPSLF